MVDETIIRTSGGAVAQTVKIDGGDYVGRDYITHITVHAWAWDKVLEDCIDKLAEQAANVTLQNQKRPVLSEHLNKLKKAKDEAKKVLVERWQPWNWQTSAEIYRQSLLDQFSTIRIL